MKIKIILITFLIALFSSCAYASEEIGHIVSLEGRVDMFKADSPDVAISLKQDDPVFVGDSIRTKSGSRAEIEFKDNTMLKIAQNSKVTVDQYSLDYKNNRISASVELSRGKARAIIAKSKNGASFVITTPNAKGTVTGSDIVASYQAGNSLMLVNQGKLSVVNIMHPKESVSVSAGNSVTIPQKESPLKPVPISISEKKMYDDDTRVLKPMAKGLKAGVIKGEIVEISGDVKIANQLSGKFHKAKMGEVVQEQDTIETASDGYVEIRLDNNNAINLKPDTKLTVIKLSFNVSTAEFDNIFEVTIGKIKARIEGLKGNSKFEVKTPTATCGARGTIEYVDVFQDHTVGFFEGGNGYITNPVSGSTQEIPAGSSSMSYANGNITTPLYVSGSNRQSYNEGWNAGGFWDVAQGGSNNTANTLGENTVNVVPNLSTLESLVDNPIPLSVFISVPITQTNPSLLPVTTTTENKQQPYTPNIGDYYENIY